MGLFDKFKKTFKRNKKEDIELYEEGLEKTRDDFVKKLSLLGIKYNKVTPEYFDELEKILIEADIGVNTVFKLIDKLKKRVKDEKIENSKNKAKYLQGLPENDSLFNGSLILVEYEL